MKILLIHLGKPWEFIASTSIISGLFRRHKNLTLDIATSEECYPFVQYNKKINNIQIGSKLSLGHYDEAINLSPSIDACIIASHSDAKVRRGFIESSGSLEFSDEYAQEAYRVLKGTLSTSRNYLQILFKISGMTWRGDGYDLAYYPKTKVKKNKTGIAILDDNLRVFVKSHLSLSMSEMWHIPLKKNLIRRIDEINRCKYIVTDDFFSLHVAIALRKHVEFIDTRGLNYDVEFFGQGNILQVINNADSDEKM